MSKGSKRRPAAVSADEVRTNWDATFPRKRCGNGAESPAETSEEERE